MEFTVHEIGEHQFVEAKGCVVAMRKITSIEDQIENLQANYDTILERSRNEEDAFLEFRRLVGMRKREAWVNYKYDGHFTHLLEDQGYYVTLPIQTATGKLLDLYIAYWKEQDGETFYQVFTLGGSPQGTIRNQGEEPKVFFERFIGEVCFHNGILEEKLGKQLFPFSSRSVREQFNFLPALVVINPVQNYINAHYTRKEG